MIRIKPNKCGYSNWSCQGIPQLSSFMFNGSNATVSAMDADIFKLPVKIKGMVYTEDTINMGWQRGGPHPEIPELTCRKDTDPDSDSQNPSVHKDDIVVNINGSTCLYPVYGGTGGWLDLYNAGYDVSGSTQFFYHDLPVPGSTVQAAAVTDVYLTVDGSTQGRIYDINNIPSFQEVEGTTVTGLTVTELEMGPGLLEPMLDTSFDPIAIDTIPAWEAGDDSFIFEAAVLNAWKGVVDDRIRNIYARINDIHPGTDDTKLRELKNEEYREAECDNFPITLDAGGSALRTYAEVSAGGSNINTYTIGSGSVLVNGAEYVVEPVTGITAPFYAYLNASAEYTSTFSSDTLPETVSSGAMYVSGGTVTEIISAAYPDYLWKWTVQYPWKTGASVEIRVVPSQPLPDVGKVGIGGVNVISGGTNADDFVLFKTFREDCIVSADLGPDDGLVNHIYPQENPPPDGPEYEAGPVFPYDNIMSGTTGTERTDWGHSAYVPTVNATYEFVHNDTYGSGDDMAATQALAHRYVTSGAIASTAALTYEYPKDDIPFLAIDNDMSSGLADMVVDAQAKVDETSAAYVADPTEANLSAYNDAQTALDTAVTSSGLYASAAVVGGTPGTVFVVSAMIASGGSMLTPTPAEAAVPTLDAVDLYVHGQYSLAQWGSVIRPSSGSPYVDHGYPGTVLTVDEIDDPLYSAGEYYYDDIPTVRAVVKYVKDHQTSATDAESGLLTISGGSAEAFDEDHMPVRGTVEVADNILVGGTPTLTKQAVPSVHAVHTFVTTYEAVGGSVSLDPYEPEVPEVVGGTTGIVKPVVNIESGTVDNSALGSVVPTALAVVEYIDKKAGPAVAGEMALGAGEGAADDEESLSDNTTGIVDVARNIVVSPNMEFISYSAKTVPTLEAVYNFIHGQTAYAVYTGGSTVLETANSLVTGGTLTPVTATGSTVITAYAPSGTQGTCYMATEIPVGATVSIGLDNCAPTVDAVITYVEGHTSTAGTITLTTPTGSTVKQESISGHTLGMPMVASNILIGGQTPNVISPEAVPTVEGVYKFIHYAPNSITGATTTELFSDPLATPSVITITYGTASESGETISNDGTPGTALVVSNVRLAMSQPFRSISKKAVPTVEGVYNFVHNPGYGDTQEATIARALATAGTLEEHSTEGTIDGYTIFTGMPGTCWLTSNIPQAATVSADILSVECVPNAGAVIDFIDGRLDAMDAVAGYLTITGTTTETLNQIGDSAPKAGFVQPVRNIQLLTFDKTKYRDKSWDAVPTVEAVCNYIHGTTTGYYLDPSGATAYPTADSLAAMTMKMTLNTAIVSGTTSYSWSAYGSRGTVVVAADIKTVVSGSTVLTAPRCVPTAQAVVDYVQSLGLGAAAAGTLTISGTSEAFAENDPASRGTVEVAKNIMVLSGGTGILTPQVAASVDAVYDFVHNPVRIVATAAAQTQALATPGEIVVDSTNNNTESFDGIPGTVEVASNVQIGAGSYSTYAVPTIAALCEYIHNDGSVPNAANALATIWSLSSGSADVTATTVTTGIPGVVQVYDSICVESDGATTVVVGGATGVPTMNAVSSYVAAYGGAGVEAIIGGMTVTGAVVGTTGCTPGIVEAVDNIKVYNDSRTAATYTEITAASAIPTASAIIAFYKTNGSSGGMAIVHELKQARTTSNGVVDTLTPSVSSMGKPGTIDVADHIYWHKASGSAPDSIFHGADMVPTLSAVAEYMDTYIPPDAVLGSMSVNAGGTATIANIGTTSYQHGVVYVGSGVVSHSNKDVTGEIVPNLKAVYDFVHTSNTSAGYKALATVHDIAVTTGAESITGGTPGTLWLAGNIMIGADGAYSTNAAASVKAVYDFVHSMETKEAPSGTGANIALATGSTITAPSGTTGTQYVNLAAGATPGTCYTVNSMMGLKGENVVLSTGYTVSEHIYLLRSVVPTVQAVKEYVEATAGKTAVLGYITVGTTESLTAVTAGETVDVGMVYTVDNIDRNATVSSRAYSSKAVPTVDAVIRYIHGEAATSGSMNDAKATAGTVVLATGSTDTAMLSGGTPGTTYTVSDMTSAYGTTIWSGSEAVPTVTAVRDYVSAYGGQSGGAIAYYGDFAAIPNVSNTQVNVSSGIFWFGTHSGTVSAASFNYTNTTNAVLWAICSGSAGSYTGTLASAPSNGPYVESYPVAQIKGGTVYQCQYGPIRITGRWM